MKASLLRSITRSLPLPGTVVRRLIDAIDNRIEYPTGPVMTSARWQCGRFEILDCREYIQRNIYFLGYYGLRESLLLRRLLRAGDVFVDVGANLGWFTVLAAREVGTQGRVFAFEPSSQIRRHLQRSVEINALTNVTVEPFALSDHDGTAVLTGLSDRNAGLGSIMNVPSPDASGSCGEEVRTTRFADYCEHAGIRKIRLMKIDVEGAEMKVLQGMQPVIARKTCDYLTIEINDQRLRESGYSASHVLDFLRAHGYRLYHINLFGPAALDDDTEIQFANVLAEAIR
jgi:FkbM family methyltransferase